jgi:hypothetical protein
MAKKGSVDKQIQGIDPADEQIKGIAALYQIDRLIGPEAESVRLAASGLGAELCKTFRLIKPYIDPALVFIKLLPKGDQIAKVVKFLVKVADAVCSTDTAKASTRRAAGAVPTAEPPPFGDMEAAFRELAKNLPDPAASRPTASGADLCTIYRQNKGWINTILSFVEWLPSGDTIAKVIRLLMQIADGLCGP